MERDLALMTLEDLTQIARQRGLRGYSTMTKTELVDALSAINGALPEQAEEAATPQAPTPSGKTIDRHVSPATQLESVVDAGPQDVSAEAAEIASAKTATPKTASEKAVSAKPGATESEALETEETDETEALEGEKPAPHFKKTWIRHELLIDDALTELPETYGDEKLVVMIRDPFWIHAYWDVTPKTIDRMHAQGGNRMALRVYDVTELVFDGRNAHTWFEIPAAEYVRNWNIQLPADGRNYVVELGWVTGEGRFIPALRSNVVDVPIGRPSPVIADKFVELPFKPAPEATILEEAEEAEAPEVAFVSAEELAPPAATSAPTQNVSLPDTMYQLSTRGRGYWSADTPRYADLTWEAMESAMGSHRLSSHGISSFSAPPAPPAEAKPKDKDFWLVANCELIVYGATEPDAKVTLRGQNIELRPDGTFSIRFAFPDGLHPIPIHAVNADGDMERSITITVSRDTQP